MASGPITLWQLDGETVEAVSDFIFGGFKITADGDCSHEIKGRLLLGRKVMTNLDSILKSCHYFTRKRHYFTNKCLSSQSSDFSSSHVWMWELEYKESWAPKNWCFWTVVLDKTLESPLDSKEIQPVHPKGNQSWIFIGKTDAEAETPILWPPDAKYWLIWKDPDAGKDWRQEKGMTEDETVGWHHWLNGDEIEQTLGGDDGQGGLTCCGPWGCKESDNWATELTTDWLTELTDYLTDLRTPEKHLFKKNRLLFKVIMNFMAFWFSLFFPFTQFCISLALKCRFFFLIHVE